ncbi:DMT family transporter [Roseobacter sinensis]|uniref:DMT family transporter n=1 Tax=Roseobacter sinensis TaxID=2931391 RepID=A0ABT3BBI3_9RHOB|nr:DMT family transporter [Roseobacter sp. WL0113]MCV3270943.1 DMT family transporter [Roseobacter sp. WL0113]
MTQQMTLSPRTWSALLLLALIWGASFLSIRIALDEIGPLTAVAHRTLWAMLVLWGVVWAMRLPIPRDPRIWGAFFGMGLFNNAIPFGLMAWGQLHVETGLTSILNAATAVFGVIAAAVFFTDERLSLRKLIGVGLGFFGVATAIGLENLREFDLRALAQLAILAGTVSYALAGVWGRKTLAGLPAQMAAAGMLTGSTAITLPLALIVEGPMRFDLAPGTVLAIAYYSVIATAGAYLLYYYVLARAGSGNLLLVTLLIAPVAILLGALVRDEALNPNAYLGFAILALGLLVLDRRLWRRTRKHPAAIDPIRKRP